MLISTPDVLKELPSARVLRAAEHTEDPRQREILLKLAVLWDAPLNGAATKHRRNRLRRIRTNALILRLSFAVTLAALRRPGDDLGTKSLG